jgi:hypothetical protein
MKAKNPLIFAHSSLIALFSSVFRFFRLLVADFRSLSLIGKFLQFGNVQVIISNLNCTNQKQSQNVRDFPKLYFLSGLHTS